MPQQLLDLFRKSIPYPVLAEAALSCFRVHNNHVTARA
jgi:hypothetical protein